MSKKRHHGSAAVLALTLTIGGVLACLPGSAGDAEPTYQFTRYLSVDLSSNQGKYIDRGVDRLFELQKDATDPAERRRALREFETRMLTEAYNVPLQWWQRIVVMSSRIKGWEMSPSHLIGQDLEKVSLAP